MLDYNIYLGSQWEKLLDWTKNVNYRDIGDETHDFVRDTKDIFPLPSNIGELTALLTVVFASGQKWEQLKNEFQIRVN